jgi:uncharacterized surface protein with fasciclin (FAS1) repeats
VPKDGKGSFNGMATDPVATAASNNPLLTTLVSAVGAAGLGDTLNTTPNITVFAPSTPRSPSSRPCPMATEQAA